MEPQREGIEFQDGQMGMCWRAGRRCGGEKCLHVSVQGWFPSAARLTSPSHLVLINPDRELFSDSISTAVELLGVSVEVSDHWPLTDAPATNTRLINRRSVWGSLSIFFYLELRKYSQIRELKKCVQFLFCSIIFYSISFGVEIVK